MNDQFRASHDPLADLIQAAGRRSAPPPRAYARALAATTSVWQAKVRRRRWRTAIGVAASIAALFIGVGLALHSLDQDPPTTDTVAGVARVIGAVSARTDDAEKWRSLHDDSGRLPSGAVLRTDAASGVALQFGEISVRIASNSEIVLESHSRVRLMQGKVYIDTGPQPGVRGMLVVTDAASVSDVGTQFEVQYLQGGYRVRVRTGEILLQRGSQRRRGGPGEQLSFRDAGAISSDAIAANDPAWAWVHALASAPEIDDQPLTVLLDWVARERGVSVRYATPGVERKASATILHGSIRHLEPLEALTVMLATTDLRHEVLTDGTIMIK